MKYKVKKRKRNNAGLKTFELAKQVIELAEPVCIAEGMELIHVEYKNQSGNKTLCVYIDKEEGVNIEDCVLISRQLGNLFDINLNLDQSYNLEVSSPGSRRPISKESDFQKFAGNSITLYTSCSNAGKKKIKGILEGISEGIVNIIVSGEQVRIPFETIYGARFDNFRKGDL
ncbi:MAG: ribosome maturation factor RimP [Deltaproteobacteria bacterium]|nr:ribosome maturation factor RimP [Deltaproteobacteria bacterium]